MDASGYCGAADEGDEFWHLRLYIAGQSPKSSQALANLKRLCEEHLADRYAIEIIDLVEYPAFARDDDIIAVPTLIRRAPAPLLRVVGDLSDAASVLAGLQLQPAASR
jgi:circadian clock protein KaiB